MIYSDRYSMDRSDKHAALRAAANGQFHIDLRVHKYRVLDGDVLLGHFPNLPLVQGTIDKRPHAKVLDVSALPARVIYRDGKWTSGFGGA